MPYIGNQSLQFAQKFDAKEIESEVRSYLSGVNLHKAVRDSNRDKTVRFIEGPPTMNGPPHAGHLRGRVIKDLWYRFNTLRGLHIIFNGGWDTQGLPIELQAEKELGVTGGKAQAIEKFGVDRIVSECKKIVSKYTSQWVETDWLLGISLDHDNAYRTLDDRYIEREWNILRCANKMGIIKEDYTVIAYCPSCQTSLSHAEVGQGYKETTDPSLYYTVELEPENAHGENKDTTPVSREKAHLVVWTTMPFTLVTDALVGVHPDEEYAYVRVDSGRTLVIGKTRLEDVIAEIGATSYEIIKSQKGRDIDGRGYVHPLRSTIPGLDDALKRNPDKYHKVVAEEFVDVSAGSGLVHIAPANGEEDIRVATERGVEVFSPIDDEVRFTNEAGSRYAGMFVRDADRAIVEDLKEAGALIKIGRIRHSYPHCWRSGHALVWLARRGFFYDTAKIGSNTTRAAEDVEYFFEQPRNRFLGIINDRHPWCISRERIWGCPLPVWKCKDCHTSTWMYSKAEIAGNAVYLPDGADFELHRPWIDGVKVRCSSCGGVNTEREDFVLDTWHNSGAAPWSSLEDDEYADSIPAPFLTEGIDQTRGWAYTLLMESVILRDGPEAPFESFLFQGHVLDERGQKMSKSKGNVMEGADMLSRYPADIIRLYFMWKASPIEPLSFSTDEMMSRPHQILSTLYNLHLYHMQNSAYDGFDAGVHTIRWAKDMLREPEVWLLSKLQGLVTTVTEKNEKCRFHEAARALDDYIINIFSQTYVRMTRSDIWNEDDDNRDRRLAVYAVLYHVLRALDIMMHPLCPHTTEYLWQTVFVAAGTRNTSHLHKNAQDSILLASWPRTDPDMADIAAEESFDFVTEVISACSAARMTKKLKGRWPLDEAIICVGTGQASRLQPLLGILREQANVEKVSIKEIEHMDDASESARALNLAEKGMPVVIHSELNGKSAGPKAKQHMPELARVFKGMPAREMAISLRDRGTYDIRMSDDATIRLDQQDISIGCGAADGFAMATKFQGSSKSTTGTTSHDSKNTVRKTKHTEADKTKHDNIAGATKKDSNTCVVFLTTSRNKELTARGLVKDVARRIQSLRKERGYSPTDVLARASILGMSEEQQQMLAEKSDEIAFLVRVQKVDFAQTCSKYVDEEIDGQKIRISVE